MEALVRPQQEEMVLFADRKEGGGRGTEGKGRGKLQKGKEKKVCSVSRLLVVELHTIIMLASVLVSVE